MNGNLSTKSVMIRPGGLAGWHWVLKSHIYLCHIIHSSKGLYVPLHQSIKKYKYQIPHLSGSQIENGCLTSSSKIYTITGMHGPLRRPSSSSCGGKKVIKNIPKPWRNFFLVFFLPTKFNDKGFPLICLSILLSRRDQPFWWSQGFIISELKPVRRVSVDANLKRFQYNLL